MLLLFIAYRHKFCIKTMNGTWLYEVKIIVFHITSNALLELIRIMGDLPVPFLNFVCETFHINYAS